MTSAISQLVYIPNFRAIGQSVWEKNGNIQTHTQTHLNFIKIDIYIFIALNSFIEHCTNVKIQTIEITAPTSIVEPSNHLHFQETPNMERINLGYSLKNIPIPSQKSYLKSFISKVDSFIHRIRWKAFFFERNAEDTNKSTDNNNDDTNANFGFKSDKTPPQHPALIPFENDLYSLIDSISFSSHKNTFQRKLAKDIKEIRNSKSVLVEADKTTNIYKMSPESYRKLLTDNITKEYKKKQQH